MSEITYTKQGDYLIPDLTLPTEPEIQLGRYAQMHRAYLEEANPLLLNHLILTGELHTYLADLNEQAQERYRHIVRQMMEAEGITEGLKRQSQWEWVKAMNSITDRVEEIIKSEICNV